MIVACHWPMLGAAPRQSFDDALQTSGRLCDLAASRLTSRRWPVVLQDSCAPTPVLDPPASSRYALWNAACLGEGRSNAAAVPQTSVVAGTDGDCSRGGAGSHRPTFAGGRASRATEYCSGDDDPLHSVGRCGQTPDAQLRHRTAHTSLTVRQPTRWSVLGYDEV